MIAALSFNRPAMNASGVFPIPASYGVSVGGERLYDAWGGVRAGQSHGYPNHRYCAKLGHVSDDETGLTYMRARYYEPGTGRFISEDPARDGVHWYVYADSDPISNVDFDGRFTVNGFTFRFDAGMGDLHVFKDGKELLSVFGNGAEHHPGKSRWTREMWDALFSAAKSGHASAQQLVDRIKNTPGNFGVPEEWYRRRPRGAAFAISSLDAYAQWDPEDFAGILRDIATGGR